MIVEHTNEEIAELLNNKNCNIVLESFPLIIEQCGLEAIFLAGKSNEEDFEEYLKDFNQLHMSSVTKEYWQKMAYYKYSSEKSSKNVMLSNSPKFSLLQVNNEGAWGSYLKKLKANDFSQHAIDILKNASQKIITELKLETNVDSPVRGMVVGNVQSGKTANMAAVISMAADKGYNFFIVLSGTIENLRKQTQSRLSSDLYVENGMINFITLENLSPKCNTYKLQDLHLEKGNRERYITVCLKNKSRLENLVKWLCSDENQKKKLKILVIDDEADQAGVNTANYTKGKITKICNLIENLVFARCFNDKEDTPYGSMNYIGYTATPYANFLNTAHPKSLYPKDFIITLEFSKDYIGPELIFGIPDGQKDTLDIINYISKDEEELMTKESLIKNIPNKLKESIIWFLITVVLFRKWDLKSPVSMLLHTSSKEPIHRQLKDITIRCFDELKNLTDSDKISTFFDVWNKQTRKLNKKMFLKINNNYESKNTVNEYPEFNEIKDELITLVNKDLTYILFDEESEKLVYSDGVHLCIDNSYNNKIIEDKYYRIAYPDKKDTFSREKCPAFIVIGGNTLSRGLTLEGLTTSYFLRNTNQADSLMQMGRWFGYHRKYEILPRIWMGQNDEEKFQYLTKLDNDLRCEIKEMYDLKHKPSEYAVKIDTFPEFAILKVTSKNKMQAAITADFSSHRGQTVKFYNDSKIIDDNLNYTIDFINDLGMVDNDKIKNYNNPVNKNNESKNLVKCSISKGFRLFEKIKIPLTIFNRRGL